MSVAELNRIATLCEKATGLDRSIDVAIWAAINGHELEWQGNTLVAGKEGVVGWRDPGEYSDNFYSNRDTIGPASIPAYTSSVDAALTLVPEGWFIDLSVRPDGFAFKASASYTHPQLIERGTWYRVEAATPALALSSAALRARAAAEPQEGE